MDPLLEKRILACPSLPSLPAVALEVVSLCRKDDLDLREVAALIERDPALASKVLRVANSVSIGARSKVTTLSRALTLLGTNTALTLALSFSLVRSRSRTRGGFDHDAYWRRALLCALAARTLAAGQQLDGEELFLAALLQDLGMLVLDAVEPRRYAALVAASGGHAALAAAERAAFGADHAEVSAFLAARWGLPPLVVETSRGSHDPAAAAGPPELVPAVAVVHVASHLAEVWTGAPADAARDAAARHLGMDGPALHSALAETAVEIPQAASDYDLALRDPEDIEAVLDAAKETLALISARAEASAREAEHAAEALAAENRGLEESARQDPLTGVLRRGPLEDLLHSAFAGAQERREPLTVAFCDVDRFKAVNDAHGHAAGDRVLAGVARAISSALRAGDAVARWGGEEFVVLMPGTPSGPARDVAERIRRAVEAQAVEGGGAPLRVTISIGQATHDARTPFVGPGALVDAADACLYEAKRGGRNRVVARR
jgi:diguanylate cyclase (GGDEF)-like protein